MPGGAAAGLSEHDATLLAALAHEPRPTGGTRIAAARELCSSELRAAGYVVRERPFTFSALPGRFGTPLVAAAAMALVAVAGHWGARGARLFPLVALLAGGVLLALVGRWLAHRAILDSRWLRESGVNLEGTRGDGPVRLWVCAHLDSKSQPVPTLVRSVGIVLQGVGSLMTLALAAAAAAGLAAPFGVWVGAAVVTLTGAVPVVLSVAGARSPGALDNASGVVTVLSAARLLADRGDVGVLITDAEELGLAGAHAWASGPGGGGALVLNCDGVDDVGAVTVMYAGRMPIHAIAAVASASRISGIPHAVRRLPPGVLTDSIAITRAGGMSVTFSRGTYASLGRVHSASDDLRHLTGRGIPETAQLMAQSAIALLDGARKIH